MARRKRKEAGDNGISSTRNEIIQLTKIAKSWDFTCSFCFRKFASAQAMGGHQNGHKRELIEEKRLFVKDPISFRMHNYLKSIRSENKSSSGSNSDENVKGNIVIGKGVIVGVNGDASLVTRNFIEKLEKATIGGENDPVGSLDKEEFGLDLTLKI